MFDSFAWRNQSEVGDLYSAVSVIIRGCLRAVFQRLNRHVDVSDGDGARDFSETCAAPFRVDDDPFRGASQATVEREVRWPRQQRRRTASFQRLGRFTRRVVAVTRHDLFQIDLVAPARLGQPKEKILQREVVKDNDARMFARYLEHPLVIAVIVAHVIDDRVVVAQSLQHSRIATVVVAGKLRAYFRVRRFKAVDEERDLGLRCEIRQKLFAVIRNPGGLWIERAEVSEMHKSSGQKSVDRRQYLEPEEM